MKHALARIAERRLPRYTSYPTVPHFEAAADDTACRTRLAALDPAAPVSLYVHIPFCQKVCWYCACNMKLAAREEPVLAYAATLKDEIELVAASLPQRMTVSQIHWGGGTPTAMPMPALIAVMTRLRKHFGIELGAEISIELDPRTFRPDMAAGLPRLGITRASLGVQEFDAEVQAAVNRVQPFESVRETVASLRAAGVTGINFDLMYGLPRQTRETITRSIELTLRLCPDRIALFGYAHVPWAVKRQRMIDEAALPGPGERFEQAETAARLLVEAGYERIGLDHFALPGDDMARACRTGTLRRNFQGYTVDAASALIGLGATAISALPGFYAQNIAETGAWTRAVESGRLPTAKTCTLTPDDLVRREVIERLMCDMQVDVAAIAARHAADPAPLLDDLEAARPFVTDGLAEIAGSTLHVTDQGRPALRAIAAIFDTYLTTGEDKVPRHAAAV